MRRVLRLLDAQDDLTLIKLEGLTPADPATASSDLLLGVDLTEYHAGGTFLAAHRVVVSQLKYSIRHPGQPWTLGRLTKGGTRAVARRLAEIFSGFRKHHTRAEVVNKLEIRLVSNQPASPSLLSMVEGARAGVSAASADSDLATRRSRARADFARWRHSAGLSEADFDDFLRVLHFDCGSESRDVLELATLRSLSDSVGVDVSLYSDALYRRVHREGLPEAASSPGLRRSDVLVTLGSDERALFPVPVRFAALDRPIVSPDVGLVRAAVQSAQHVLVQGPGGSGKTSTVRQLGPALPPESTVVIYDCYGKGDYQSPATARHRPERALVQIINELAVKTGLPLLVNPPRAEHDLWSLLELRVGQASAALQARGGRLVLVIDAADIAAYASRESRETSFIPGLWRIQLPANATVLMTCRPHREPDLDAPPTATRVSLAGFDPPSSSAHLRGWFPSASDADCAAFHRLTTGNPRLQFYLLELARRSGARLASVLRERGGAWTELLQEIIDEVITHDPDPAAARRHLATLIAMPRPASLRRFADVTHVDPAAAERLADGLVLGLTREGDHVSLRDEDFETQLRSSVTEQELRLAHDALASYCLARQASDARSAEDLADHLLRAERHDELVELVLEGIAPTAISDPLRRLRAHTHRIELGLQIALERADQAAALKLTILAAEAAKTNTAVSAMVHERPDLAMRFGEPDAVAREYAQPRAARAILRLHLRVAAMLARAEEFARARDHLERAEAAIRMWSSLPDHERREWAFGPDDVAAGAEAIHRLTGPRRARAFVMRWRPDAFRQEVTDALAARLAASVEPSVLASGLARLRIPPLGQARFYAKMWDAHRAPSTRRIRALGDLVRRRQLRRERDGEWALSFCELLASARYDRTGILEILRRIDSPMPAYLGVQRDVAHLDASLRAACLDAVLSGRRPAPEELLPAALRPPGDKDPAGYDPRAQERGEFKRALERMVPIYTLRARVLVGSATKAALEELVAAETKRIAETKGYRFREFDRQHRAWARTLANLVARFHGDAIEALERVVELAPDAVFGGDADLWLDIAERIRTAPRYRAAALRLIDRAAATTARPLSATDRSATLMRAAGLAEPLDGVFAKDLYGRALDAAGGLDDEGAARLRVHTAMAHRVASPANAEAAVIAERLARTLERYRPHVSSEEHLPSLETLDAVTAMHPPAGFALLARWDDADALRLEAGVGSVVRVALAHRFIEPWTALALLRLSGEGSALTSGLAELVAQADTADRAVWRQVTDEATRWVIRDVDLEARPRAAAKLMEAIAKSGRGLTPLQEPLRSLAGLEERPTQGSRISARPRAVRSLEPFGSSINGFLRTYPSKEQVAAFVFETGRGRPPSDRVPFLNEVVGLEPEHPAFRFYAHGLVEGLRQCLDEWSASTSVHTWAESGIPRLLVRHLPHLVREDPSAATALSVLLGSPLVTNPVRALVDAVRTHLVDLSGGQLLRLAAALTQIARPADVQAALLWSLSKLEGGDASAPVLPTAPDEVVGTLLWSAFGHPDRRVRWRAAHALRLISRGNSAGATLDALMAMGKTTALPAFREPGLEFYWMSARVHLQVALARIADERPELLRKYAAELASTALDPAFPHVIIRHFAARAAQSVWRHDPSALDSATAGRLAAVNTSGACRLGGELDDSAPRLGRFHRRPGARFDFDAMDTLPYWYDPLGNVFGVSGHDIAARAEAWVVDRWGFSDKDTWDDKRIRQGGWEWDEASHRQGSIPPREDLERYIELHAMYVVAGEMVDAGTPVSHHRWTNEDGSEIWEDAFAAWLARHVDVSPDWWVADLRAPTPIDQIAVLPKRGQAEAWLDVPAELFDKELGIDHLDDGWITVSRWTRHSSDEAYGHTSLDTALVGPAVAGALARTLETLSPSDFRLPLESESYGLEIDDGPFVLSGWLAESRRDEGIETHDPLRRIHLNFQIPGEIARRALGLTSDSRQLTWCAASGEEVARVTLWSDEASSRRRDRPDVSGHELRIRIGALLRLLRSLGRDLIITVSGQRWKAGTREPSEPIPARGRVYLLRASGRLEWQGGRRDLRRFADQGTSTRGTRRHPGPVDG